MLFKSGEKAFPIELLILIFRPALVLPPVLAPPAVIGAALPQDELPLLKFEELLFECC